MSGFSHLIRSKPIFGFVTGIFQVNKALVVLYMGSAAGVTFFRPPQSSDELDTVYVKVKDLIRRYDFGLDLSMLHPPGDAAHPGNRYQYALFASDFLDHCQHYLSFLAPAPGFRRIRENPIYGDVQRSSLTEREIRRIARFRKDGLVALRPLLDSLNPEITSFGFTRQQLLAKLGCLENNCDAVLAPAARNLDSRPGRAPHIGR